MQCELVSCMQVVITASDAIGERDCGPFSSNAKVVYVYKHPAVSEPHRSDCAVSFGLP